MKSNGRFCGVLTRGVLPVFREASTFIRVDGEFAG